mmetsp:Transcript_499/g.3634  ORF Transcript_499/g.3634 Transcript_499/m.3634 type:complete len:98 (-) Transcript_499:474-767(-)
MKDSDSFSQKLLAISVCTARRCFKSLLFPTSMITCTKKRSRLVIVDAIRMSYFLSPLQETHNVGVCMIPQFLQPTLHIVKGTCQMDVRSVYKSKRRN